MTPASPVPRSRQIEAAALCDRPGVVSIADALSLRARQLEDAEVFTFIDSRDREQVRSYAELDAAARRVAAELVDRKAGGEPVLLLFPPGLELIEAFLGCQMAGAIAVPSLPPRRNRQMARLNAIAGGSGCGLVLTSSALEEDVAAWIRSSGGTSGLQWVATDRLDRPPLGAPLVARGHDLAFLQFTSGSTSSPKGVMVSHRNLLYNLEMIKQCFRYGEDDVLVSWLPFFHDMGLIAFILETIYLGARCVLMPPASFVRRPVRWLQAISRHGGTASGAPSFAYQRCLAIDEHELVGVELGTWRLALNAAEPVRYQTMKRFAAKYAPYGFSETSFFPAYGLAEATVCVTGTGRMPPTYLTVDAEALERNEVLMPGPSTRRRQTLVGCGTGRWLEQQLRIVDPETRRPQAPFEIGEIWVAGEHVASGYWRLPAASAETFSGILAESLDAAGPKETEPAARPFLRTGDLGFVDDHGQLFITGRIKDLVIIHGANHYPQDLEATVEAAWPELAPHATAAFTADGPDDRSMLCIVAEVRRTSLRSFDATRAGEVIANRLAKDNDVQVDRVVFLKPHGLPMTSSGKVQRAECRRMLQEGLLPAVGSWPAEPGPACDDASGEPRAMSFLRDQLSQYLDRPASSLPEDEVLSRLGLESVHYHSLVAAARRILGVEVPTGVLLGDPTLSELARALCGHRPSRSTEQADRATDCASIIAAGLERIPQVFTRVDHQQGRAVVIGGRVRHDFASCNYLGLDEHPEVIAAIPEMLSRWGVHPSWTRAVASPAPYLELEERLAKLIGAPEVLVFPNVAMVNLGCLPILAGPRGTIIADTKAHNTIHEACEVARSRGIDYLQFRHGDLDDLRRLLVQQHEHRPLVIALDGVYSMNISYCGLHELAAVAREHEALLYVDDAHGFGILGESPGSPGTGRPYGSSGNGIVRFLGMDCVQHQIVYVAGLSKAYSSHAAFISCLDQRMRSLLQTASTFIFSGPVPVATLASALRGLEVNQREGDVIRERILKLSRRLVDGARAIGLEVDNTGYFPAAFVVVGGMEQAIRACSMAWEHDLLITPGVYPAVPRDRCGLRFAVTALNTEHQVEMALEALARIYSEIVSTSEATVTPAGPQASQDRDASEQSVPAWCRETVGRRSGEGGEHGI